MILQFPHFRGSLNPPNLQKSLINTGEFTIFYTFWGPFWSRIYNSDQFWFNFDWKVRFSVPADLIEKTFRKDFPGRTIPGIHIWIPDIPMIPEGWFWLERFTLKNVNSFDVDCGKAFLEIKAILKNIWKRFVNKVYFLAFSEFLIMEKSLFPDTLYILFMYYCIPEGS